MSQNDDDPASQNWHIDKRIPVAIIVTIVMQSMAAVWFASGIAHRVENLERIQSASAPQGDRIIRLEERMTNLTEYIIEIRNILRQRSP